MKCFSEGCEVNTINVEFENKRLISCSFSYMIKKVLKAAGIRYAYQNMNLFASLAYNVAHKAILPFLKRF